jgi:hypothetical protein
MISKRPHAEALDPLKAATVLAQEKGYDPEVTKNIQAWALTLKK